jgi:5,10-methylene-tetrahydrofolate dehydrogenase/methenyl tetrahydrofolate cyclohydrolase
LNSFTGDIIPRSITIIQPKNIVGNPIFAIVLNDTRIITSNIESTIDIRDRVVALLPEGI